MDENVNSLRGQNHAENLCSKQNFEPIALPGETDKSTETVEIATPVSQKVVGQLETTCDLSVPPKAAHTCPQVLDVDPATWPSTRLLQGLRRHAENSTGQSRFSHGDIWRGNRAVPGNPGGPIHCTGPTFLDQVQNLWASRQSDPQGSRASSSITLPCPSSAPAALTHINFKPP